MKTEITTNGNVWFSFEHKKGISLKKALEHAKGMHKKVIDANILENVQTYVKKSNGEKFFVENE